MALHLLAAQFAEVADAYETRGPDGTLLGPSGLRALELGNLRLRSGQVSYRMYARYSLEKYS